MNRIVWDVRGNTGLSMPPGRYQARLTVDGKAATQPFTVLIDPRLAVDGVTTADLKEQYDHNVRVRNYVGQIKDKLEQV